MEVINDEIDRIIKSHIDKVEKIIFNKIKKKQVNACFFLRTVVYLWRILCSKKRIF